MDVSLIKVSDQPTAPWTAERRVSTFWGDPGGEGCERFQRKYFPATDRQAACRLPPLPVRSGCPPGGFATGRCSWVRRNRRHVFYPCNWLGKTTSAGTMGTSLWTSTPGGTAGGGAHRRGGGVRLGAGVGGRLVLTLPPLCLNSHEIIFDLVFAPLFLQKSL